MSYFEHFKPSISLHMHCIAIVSFYIFFFLYDIYGRMNPVLDHLSMLLRREGLPFIRSLILNLPKYSWARVIKIYPQQLIFYRELKQLPLKLGVHPPSPSFLCHWFWFLILTDCQLLTDPQCFPRFIICNSDKHSSLGMLCQKHCFYQNLRNRDNKSHW